MTYDEKVERFRAGAYAMNAPPVQHANWEESDWIEWIGDSGFCSSKPDGSANTTDRHVKLYP